MPEYRTRDGDVLDWICWKHYGATEDVVEAVLDANPHLADRGPVYAAGVIVTLRNGRPRTPPPRRRRRGSDQR